MPIQVSIIDRSASSAGRSHPVPAAPPSSPPRTAIGSPWRSVEFFFICLFVFWKTTQNSNPSPTLSPMTTAHIISFLVVTIITMHIIIICTVHVFFPPLCLILVYIWTGTCHYYSGHLNRPIRRADRSDGNFIHFLILHDGQHVDSYVVVFDCIPICVVVFCGHFITTSSPCRWLGASSSDMSPLENNALLLQSWCEQWQLKCLLLWRADRVIDTRRA